MTILGDALDAILAPLDYNGRKQFSTISENSVGGSSGGGKQVYRPWNEILVVNKGKWTTKHEAGIQTKVLKLYSYWVYCKIGLLMWYICSSFLILNYRRATNTATKRVSS